MKIEIGKAQECKTICPYCDYNMDRVSSVNNQAQPSPGDVTVCIQCAQVAIFCDDLSLRKTTKEEDRQFRSHPYLLKLQEAIKKVDRKKDVK